MQKKSAYTFPHRHRHTRTHTGSLAQRTRLRIRQHFPTTPRKLQDFSPLLFSPFYHDLCRINRQKDQVLHAPPGSSLSPAPASSLVPLNCKRIRESASATEHLEFTTAQNEKLQNASRRVKRVRVRVRRQPREPEPETSPVQASQPSPASAGRATLGIRIRIRVRYAFCGKLSNQQRLPNDNWNLETLRRYTFIASSFSLCLLGENAISVSTISAMSWQVQLKK